jgi:thiamine-monophosphate kinase
MTRSGGRTLADVGERGLVAALIAQCRPSADVRIGPGDDCAQLRLGGRDWLWTTDSQVEGTHFDLAWMTPRQLGAKAYLINASDIAAMGGWPRFALVSLGAPSTFSSSATIAIQRGISEMAARDGVAIVGGNVTRCSHLEVTVSLLGLSPKVAVSRSGARAGDAIYVSGTLGDAALGLRLLRANPRAMGSAVRRFRQPVPRLRAGAALARTRVASAMIDLSDGLLEDLRRLCHASGTGAQIDVRTLPISRAVDRADRSLALDGGEDYELLCAVPARKESVLARISAELDCTMTRVGEFCDSVGGVVLMDGAGPVDLPRRPFAHFSPSGPLRK